MRRSRIEFLIAKAYGEVVKRQNLVDSYGGPSPDGGLEAARLHGASVALLAAREALQDGNTELLDEIVKAVNRQQ